MYLISQNNDKKDSKIMTTYQSKTHFFKKKMDIYKDSKYSNIPVCEQIAILFTVLAKEIDISEELYSQKKFEDAYKIVHENLSLCGKLCEILTEMHAQSGTSSKGDEWMNYFSHLMQGIVLLSSNHNIERKIKLIKSIHEMAGIWRNKRQTLTDELQNVNHSASQEKADDNLNINFDI
jgi:hypothetical protein